MFRLFGVGFFYSTRLLRAMRTQSTVLGAVPFASFFHCDHGLELLAYEVFSVERFVFGKPGIQTCLEHIPSLRADLDAVLSAAIRVVGKLKAFMFAFGNAELEFQLRTVLIDGLCFEDFQHVAAGVQELVSLSN